MLPTVVLLERAPERFSDAWPLDVTQLKGNSVERFGRDGRHLIVTDEATEFRFWFGESQPGQPLAVVIPLDENLPARAETALRLWARIIGSSSEDGAGPHTLTRQRCGRLVLMLRAIDGHLTEATYREIAETLFGAGRVEREAWKTSSLRDRTIRLVKGGMELMRHGYRKLLRGR